MRCGAEQCYLLERKLVSAAEVMALMHARWQIELLWKVGKQWGPLMSGRPPTPRASYTNYMPNCRHAGATLAAAAFVLG